MATGYNARLRADDYLAGIKVKYFSIHPPDLASHPVTNTRVFFTYFSRVFCARFQGHRRAAFYRDVGALRRNVKAED